MIESIIKLDQQLFLYLNRLNSKFFDSIMLYVSKSYTPVFLILVLVIGFGVYKFKRKAILLIFFCFFSLALSDGISSRLFKPTFKRLRPCHEPQLKERVYTAGKNCWGGKYGFVSSHAANTFAAATFIFLVFLVYTKKTFFLFIWAALVSYSRIYLAKHYPLDIFFGALLGILCGYFSHWLFTWSCHLKLKWFSQDL